MISSYLFACLIIMKSECCVSLSFFYFWVSLFSLIKWILELGMEVMLDGFDVRADAFTPAF